MDPGLQKLVDPGSGDQENSGSRSRPKKYFSPKKCDFG